MGMLWANVVSTAHWHASSGVQYGMPVVVALYNDVILACSIQSMNHALGALVIEQKLAADAATAAVKVSAMRSL
jgi:hypothetical protein